MVTHPAPPTDPYVRNERIRFLKQSRCCPLLQSNGGLATRLVSTKSLSCIVPSGSPARRRLPSHGSLGLRFPTFRGTMRRYDCHLPLSGSSLVARSPIPCVLPSVCGLPEGLVTWSKRPDHARAFGHPVPHSRSLTRRQVALPSSRATPVNTYSALRPRWCLAYSPSRTQDCCLPATARRRLSLAVA